jgi:hypothetical protein
MLISKNWKCPYCGIDNGTRVDSVNVKRAEVAYCDTEVGGCDEMVVLQSKLEIHVEVRMVLDPSTE